MNIPQRFQLLLSRRPSFFHFIVFLLVYSATAISYQHFIGKAALSVTLLLAVVCSIFSGFVTHGHQSMIAPLKRCAQAIANQRSIQETLTYGIIIFVALGSMKVPETPQGIEVLRIADVFAICLAIWIPIILAMSGTGMRSAISQASRWVAIVSVFRACLSVYIDPLIASAWALRAELTLGLIAIVAFSLSHSVITKLSFFFQEPIVPLGIVGVKVDKSPSKDDVRRIAAHEGAHALVYAGLKELPVDLEIHCLDKTSGNALGYVTGYASPNKLPDRNNIRWQMLVLLAGKEGEILSMGQASLGCSTDYERWESLAKTYLSTAEDVRYFAKPASKIELSNNTLQLNLLKKTDIALLSDFFSMNAEVYGQFVEKIKHEKVLRVVEIRHYLDQVVFPENFPQQVI
jgi:hypothetical protein